MNPLLNKTLVVQGPITREFLDVVANRTGIPRSKITLDDIAVFLGKGIPGGPASVEIAADA